MLHLQERPGDGGEQQHAQFSLNISQNHFPLPVLGKDQSFAQVYCPYNTTSVTDEDDNLTSSQPDHHHLEDPYSQSGGFPHARDSPFRLPQAQLQQQQQRMLVDGVPHMQVQQHLQATHQQQPAADSSTYLLPSPFSAHPQQLESSGARLLLAVNTSARSFVLPPPGAASATTAIDMASCNQGLTAGAAAADWQQNMTTPGQAPPAEQLGCDQQQQLQPPPQVQGCRFLHHSQWQSSAQEVLRLLPRLNQEYKREVQLLLRACQVASSVAKYSNPPEVGPGVVLLLSPAAKEQLQRQVLGNCNDKHATVIAAFRAAAQAAAAATSSRLVGPAAASAGIAVAAQPKEAFSSKLGWENNLELAMLEGEEATAAAKALQEALQHLRSSYQQELVAATSALFAICKGFGQGSHVMVASSQPIKSALVAAQQQHLRVEQLWQDLMLAAAGGASC